MTPFLTVLVALLAIALIVAAIAAAVVALGALAGAAFGWAYVPVAAARYERRQRASLAALDLPPSQTYRPHRDTTTDPAGVESDSYWTEARRVAADAAGDTATTAHHRRGGVGPPVVPTGLPVAGLEDRQVLADRERGAATTGRRRCRGRHRAGLAGRHWPVGRLGTGRLPVETAARG